MTKPTNAAEPIMRAGRRVTDRAEVYYLPEIGGAELIRFVRDQLYLERTLNADDMRDLADKLRLALEHCLIAP